MWSWAISKAHNLYEGQRSMFAARPAGSVERIGGCEIRVSRRVVRVNAQLTETGKRFSALISLSPDREAPPLPRMAPLLQCYVTPVILAVLVRALRGHGLRSDACLAVLFRVSEPQGVLQRPQRGYRLRICLEQV